MGDKEDYLTSYREFFENFAATVNPEDQLPVHIAGYTITEAELPGEVLYWTTQYLTEKQCPETLLTPLRRIILDEVRVASKKHPNEFGYKSDESVYIALRLMQAVTARVNDVCLRYLDNSRLDSLPPPPPPAQRELKTVSIATKNSRRAMEDRHIEIGNLEALFGIETTEPTSFYAVYDGHAGSAAATYCAAHLHQYLVESPHFTTDLKTALRDAFIKTDADFVRKSNQERACGGSTAVAVAVRGRRLVAAWAGDSLALLAKRMGLMQLVRPHKPNRQDEKDRIESSGGTVMFWGTWRVNGQLAVSRAIGDAQYKPYVTARPETTIVELDGDEDFVVVACDGLWDFVSEDDVALSVYRQLAADPDDLKAVTKRLVVQAKRLGSNDNISIIVVFLKDPRDIAADNCPPMDLGLDNALANAPPFAMETEACKRVDAAAMDAEADCDDAAADNGVDNSDSDSEDLGPETAVDVDADDLDSDARHHEPQPPTPPAHAVEANHVDGGLVENVAESGEESEDEWNYFKGERERRDEPNEPARSETPCQDNSAWETSSVDMNSSPLNPDAPVFVPGGVSDVVLAESPRKPLPMDDIELPDVAQFNTEAVVRPADLLDLDNCDQLNGHHNVSIDETVKEHCNGNDKCNMDSLGFGFSVGIESDKVNDTGLIQDFERIQKDTTDFCNIQVFQAHSETNPFAADGNEELFERLKNKERDPMSMSFYQEKDDDTMERVSHDQSRVDLNAVQQLPDSDDEEAPSHDDKENLDPDADLLGTGDVPEPNNDIIRFDDRSDNLINTNFGQGDNLMDYEVAANNMQNYANLEFENTNGQEEVAHTDTPESHKLLFEQIPEIPDGKSSELGFSNEDTLDPSESEIDRAITPQEETSQDVDMEIKQESLSEEIHPRLSPEPNCQSEHIETAPADIMANDITECEVNDVEVSAPLATTPDQPLTQQNTIADVHQDSQQDVFDKFDFEERIQETKSDIRLDSEPCEDRTSELGEGIEDVLLPAESEVDIRISAPTESPAPEEIPLPRDSPVQEIKQSPEPTHVPVSPVPLLESTPSPLPTNGPAESPLPTNEPAESPVPTREPLLSPVPSQELSQSPVPPHEPVQSPLPSHEPVISPLPPHEPPQSPLPLQEPVQSPLLTQERSYESVSSPLPSQEPVQSPLPPHAQSPLPSHEQVQSPLPSRESVQSPHELASSPPPSEPVQSQAPTELLIQSQSEAESNGPAPDIVPEQRSPITDIDIGIESRAQEICVPVTNEIQEFCASVANEIREETAAPAPLSDTPIAADVAPAAAVVAVAATAAATAAVAGTKATSAKKAPAAAKTSTTAKPAPKTTLRPSSATKKPATPTAARPTTATSVTKSPAVPRTTPVKASTPLKSAPAKPPTPGAIKAPAPGAAKPAAAKGAPAPRVPPITRPVKETVKTSPAPTKAAPVKEVTAKPAPISRAARPAPRPAPARPASAPAKPAGVAPRPAAPRAAPVSAARPAAPKAPEKKPLTNGDVKSTARPLPKAPARAAPRPVPRAAAPAPAPAPPAPAAPKSAPKPAPRARPAPRDADKLSKDLANRRLTAKAAPPRTAAAKVPAGSKPVPVKMPARRAAEAGVGAAAAEGVKAPPSPPADGALLPDVIA